MDIVQPYAKIMELADREAGVQLPREIEWRGRVSRCSEERQAGDSWERFIRTVVLEHGDWSIVERASVTVDFLVDRGVTHEIVRHRLFSYAGRRRMPSPPRGRRRRRGLLDGAE